VKIEPETSKIKKEVHNKKWDEDSFLEG
jgi:hypothetical protein